MTTILAAILYELSVYTIFLETSSYLGPQSHNASRIADWALYLFTVLAGSFIFPLALLYDFAFTLLKSIMLILIIM